MTSATFAAILLCFPSNLPAADGEEGATSDELIEMSLEDLLNLEVTSVSKKSEKLSSTSSAVYVITQEDIRRSTAKCIPDLLRMVPGVQVARIDANTWAISARGFNEQYANKLLVLIDGRSVYDPLLSGVYWSQQDTLLEDIERIEVIRGPGASVWGANAVNGVINIITKHARDTQGGLLTAAYGNEIEGFGSVRYGNRIGDDIWYRVYTKYTNTDNSVFEHGHDAEDAWNMTQGGFRLDWDLRSDDELTFQGDLYGTNGGNTLATNYLTPPYRSNVDYNSHSHGSNLLARWERTLSDSSSFSLQASYDHSDTDVLWSFEQACDAFDIAFNHQFAYGRRQEIIWGLGYRTGRLAVNNSTMIGLNNETRKDNILSCFLQDRITIVDDLFSMTLGSKLEHNDYTGYEIQPTVRALWTPHEKRTVWAAASRAVRTPSAHNCDGMIRGTTIPGVPPMQMVFTDNEDMESEKLIAFELGYRVEAMEDLSLDTATFFNIYRDLMTAEVGTPFLATQPVPHLVMPLTFDNRLDGRTWGVEIAADWLPAESWRFRGSYSFLQIQLYPAGNSTDTISEEKEGWSPHHQVSLLSYLDITDDIELDAGVRYVDRLPATGIDAYVGFDLRLAWRPLEDLEVSLAGTNLFQRRHIEFTHGFSRSPATEVERSVYLGLTWRF